LKRFKNHEAVEPRVALGTASWAVHERPLDVRGAARVLRAAEDAGVAVVDTALAYATRSGGSAEELLAGALRRIRPRSRPRVATKGGHLRRGDSFPVDGRPESLRRHCEQSLRALGVEQIALYFLHWPDPDVPVAESVGALAELQAEGKVGEIGVSNVSTSQLAEARSTARVAAVQNRLALGAEDGVLAACRAAGIAFFAYAPFRGLAVESDRTVGAIAGVHGVSPHQVIVAAYLAAAPNVTVVVGARRPLTIRDSAQASRLRLSAPEVAAIAGALRGA
jgi:aryl-alcohol dehydrogenase-like predicted oxidoreductase